MNYFVANLKQNQSLPDLESWVKEFDPPTKSDTTVIVAPSSPYLSLPVIQDLRSKISIAAQNINVSDSGAHTGSVGVDQLKDLVDYCIIGHSETRDTFNDTDGIVAAKANLLVKAGITPIICLDLPYLDSQLEALKHELLEVKDVVFAFEPADAIGSGKSENPATANETAFKIKVNSGNKELPVLYGGSVDDQNITDYTSQENINGALIGSASLDPVRFSKIISNG